MRPVQEICIMYIYIYKCGVAKQTAVFVCEQIRSYLLLYKFISLIRIKNNNNVAIFCVSSLYLQTVQQHRDTILIIIITDAYYYYFNFIQKIKSVDLSNAI